MTAAWGGLKPAPDRRLRRAFRHLPYSLLRRTVIEPHGVTDDLGRESIAVIVRRLAGHVPTVPAPAQLDNARATDAPVQIRCARAAVSLGSRTRAESLPSRATSTSVGAPPLAPKAGVRRMGCGDVCLLNDEGYRAIEGSSRPPLINLTVPFPVPSSSCTLAQPRCHRSRGRTNTDRLPDQQRMAQAPPDVSGGRGSAFG